LAPFFALNADAAAFLEPVLLVFFALPLCAAAEVFRLSRLAICSSSTVGNALKNAAPAGRVPGGVCSLTGARRVYARRLRQTEGGKQHFCIDPPRHGILKWTGFNRNLCNVSGRKRLTPETRRHQIRTDESDRIANRRLLSHDRNAGTKPAVSGLL
jgi:hypothetical protein